MSIYIKRSLPVIISLFFSLNVCSASDLSVESSNATARLKQGKEYLEANQLKKAHRQLIESALQGNQEALVALGSLFEKQSNIPVNGLPFAENWYEYASNLGLEEGEEGYARVLEEQFNRRRAKQVSSITSLDELVDESLENDKLQVPVKENISENRINTDIVIISIIVFIALVVFTIKRLFRRKKENQTENYEQQISDKNKKIRTLQNNLNKTFEQLKKLQLQTQKQNREQSYAFACAVLGFNPNKLPDEKAIKLRYKKLSRIYHPDANGSEEEMKRLNTAIKIITARKKKS